MCGSSQIAKTIIDHAARDERAAAGSKVGLAVFLTLSALFSPAIARTGLTPNSGEELFQIVHFVKHGRRRTRVIGRRLSSFDPRDQSIKLLRFRCALGLD